MKMRNVVTFGEHESEVVDRNRYQIYLTSRKETCFREVSVFFSLTLRIFSSGFAMVLRIFLAESFLRFE